MKRWEQHTLFVMALGDLAKSYSRHSPLARHSDGGPAVPFDRDARRRRNRAVRNARRRNRG